MRFGWRDAHQQRQDGNSSSSSPLGGQRRVTAWSAPPLAMRSRAIRSRHPVGPATTWRHALPLVTNLHRGTWLSTCARSHGAALPRRWAGPRASACARAGLDGDPTSFHGRQGDGQGRGKPALTSRGRSRAKGSSPWAKDLWPDRNSTGLLTTAFIPGLRTCIISTLYI